VTRRAKHELADFRFERGGLGDISGGEAAEISAIGVHAWITFKRAVRKRLEPSAAQKRVPVGFRVVIEWMHEHPTAVVLAPGDAWRRRAFAAFVATFTNEYRRFTILVLIVHPIQKRDAFQ
jgi:hypothetical protein